MPMEKDFESWLEFKTWVQQLNEDRKNLQASAGRSYISDFIYRGQPDSDFALKTSLERWIGGGMSVNRYFDLINSIRGQVETETNRLWQPPAEAEFEEWVKKNPTLLENGIPDYSYLAYLRHNGFPSPLLDWTESPYVAAFFAFRKAVYRKQDEEKGKKVSIFAFLEWGGEGKRHFGSEPLIYTLQGNVRTHRRHYLQQSCYTVCIQKRETALHFVEYEEILKKHSLGNSQQDLLWKANLPLAAWRDALMDLKAFNINAYSLFSSEESLMETLETNKLENTF